MREKIEQKHDCEDVEGRRICRMMFDELPNVEEFVRQIGRAVS